MRRASFRLSNISSVSSFIGQGSTIDVSVSSLGDATSLAGGTLIATPLLGADGQIYAVAQGPVAVSGFAELGQAESLTQGIPTVGRVPNGGLIERDLPAKFSQIPNLVLELSNPDFRTAVRIADAINQFTRERYGIKVAKERAKERARLERKADFEKRQAKADAFVQEQEAPIARGPLSSVSCPPSYTPHPSRCPSYTP